jgi:hypothetical protein
MVIDYKARNSVIIKDRFPLTLPEELIDHLQGKYYFLKMDVHPGYHQCQVAIGDIEKTMFI